MRPGRLRRLNLLLAVLVIGVLTALGIVLLDGERDEPGSEQNRPGQAQCGKPSLTYADGTPLAEDRAQDVAGVHAAACAGDYNALVPFIRDASQTSRPGPSAAEIVEGWRREDPAGVKLQIVATVLERPGVGGQGGLTFCEPDKGLIAFSRGTIDTPPGLGGVEFPRKDRPIDCPTSP